MKSRGVFPWKLCDAFNLLFKKGLSTTHTPTDEHPCPNFHYHQEYREMCTTDTRKLKLGVICELRRCWPGMLSLHPGVTFSLAVNHSFHLRETPVTPPRRGAARCLRLSFTSAAE